MKKKPERAVSVFDILWRRVTTHFGVERSFDPKVRYTDTYANFNIIQTTAFWGYTEKNEVKFIRNDITETYVLFN